MADARTEPELAVLPTRSARSCKECSRRKTACDRNIPCSACVKRGAAAACSAAPSKRRKPNQDPAHELSKRQSAALEELRLFRTTLDSLRARLPGLEHFVANAQLKDEDAAELDEVVKGFGDPVTSLASLREEEGEPPGGAVFPPPLNRSSSSFVADASTSRTLNGDRAAEPAKKKARLVEPKREEEQSGSNVEAAVNLEFHALGRPRTWAEAAHIQGPADDGEGSEADGPDIPISPSSRLAVLPPVALSESPTAKYPDGEALQAVEPGGEAETVLLHVGLDLFGFHHSVVHPSSFRSQVAAFHALGDDAFSQASPAWLSLYFALLAVSAKLVSREQSADLGWTDERMFKAASDWFECSVACLYRSNFLQVHDFFTLQAIAVLVLSGRDAGSATLIASLLYSGLSIAQDMGLTRLPSDEAWDAALKGRSKRMRAKSLIEREIRKRTLWALVHSEQFAIPFKGYSLLTKVNIATPLPLNATDEDLATGELIDRPRDFFTAASWLLRYIEIGGLMANSFEHSSSEKGTAAQAYHNFLEADKQLDALWSDLPAWLKEEGDSMGMPEGLVETLRSTFRISLQHKILSVHRPFLAKPSRATTYAFSRRRVIDAARAILREAPIVLSHNIRVWTVLYHLSVALFSLCLELFQQLKQPSPDNEAIREEIVAALPALEAVKDVSAIAERGLGLVLPLLADEERVRIEGADVKGKRKAKSASRKISTSQPSTAHASPTLPNLSALPPSGDLPVTPPFANSFVPSATSPDASSTSFPFASSYTSAAAAGYDPSAPGGLPSLPPGFSAPTAIPPWLYGDLYSNQLSGLDGAGSAGTPGAAGMGGGGTPMPFAPPFVMYGAAGGFPPYSATGVNGGGGAGMYGMGGGAPWGGMMPFGSGGTPEDGGGFGAALGWDWMGGVPIGYGGAPGGTGGGGAVTESPAREERE
ncbi:hypothetical protein JCM8547_001333 [Rhodosporidiobolus lusitaniae]